MSSESSNRKENRGYICQADDLGVRIKVHLTPRASKEEVGGLHGDALKVRVKAPPVEGRANEALIRLMARVLGVGKKSVELVSGRTGRTKTIRVVGLSPGEVRKRLGQGRA